VIDKRAEWVARHGCYETPGRRLGDDDFERCVVAICSIGAPYNIGGSTGSRWRITPWHVSVRMPRKPLASHDMNELTRLVIAAHRHLVRIQVEGAPGGPGGAATLVSAWPRSADGDAVFERHPTLDDLVAAIAATTEGATGD